MRRIVLAILLALAVGAGTSCSPPAPEASRPNLDAMFQRLRTTRDPVEAESIEFTIRHVWAESGHADIDRQVMSAVRDIHTGDTDQALAILDSVVATAPAYIEGWDLRATVHSLRDEYGPAVSDLEHVLTLEPRHFPALIRLGRIMLDLNHKKAALRAFRAALAINPHLDAVRAEADALEDELSGQPI